MKVGEIDSIPIYLENSKKEYDDKERKYIVNASTRGFRIIGCSGVMCSDCTFDSLPCYAPDKVTPFLSVSIKDLQENNPELFL